LTVASSRRGKKKKEKGKRGREKKEYLEKRQGKDAVMGRGKESISVNNRELMLLMALCLLSRELSS